ncbi:MAG: ABC transporter permease [Nitrososphaerales archaeon]|nr:ABC transporter permease [Nitrososphaerales archaeon]
MSDPFFQRAWRKLRTIGALTYYAGILPIIRIPTLLPFVFATPFTILFILFVTGRGDAIIYGLAGAMAMTVAQQGLILGADLTSFKIEHKFQAMVVASPVSAMTYMVAVALSELAFASPPLIILLIIIGYTVAGITAVSLLEILGVILLTWITTSSIGFFLSTYVLNTRTAFITISFLSILVSVLPPVFYPIQVIPSQFRWLAELVPTTHASILLQNAIGIQVNASQLTLSWLALPALTVAFLSLALFKARWREP